MIHLGTIILFGLLAVIVLVEVLDHVVAALRRRFASQDVEASSIYSGSFSLRRGESALRERYRKVHFRDQISEYCKYKDDPYDA